MDYRELKKFIEYARSKVPAKFQRPFRIDLQTWVLNMDAAEKRAFASKLQNKPEFWSQLADDMFKMFRKKEGVPSTDG